MDAYCLADFFNLNLWPTGREATFSDVRDGLEALVSESLKASCATELTVRLYGGWNGQVPNTRSSLRDLTVRVLRDFPRRVQRVRLRLELAESPVWDRSMQMLGTVKNVRIPRVPGRFGAPAACKNPAGCTLGHFRSWAAGRCPEPDCRVNLGAVGSKFEQKMVDTMLVVDALHLARAQSATRLLLASDDEDMIPCFLALMAAGSEPVHMTRTGGFGEYYAGILERDGITIHQW